MNMNMGNVAYWHKNQVVITFHSDLDPSTSKDKIAEKVREYRTKLNEVLKKDMNLALHGFDKRDIPRPQQRDEGVGLVKDEPDDLDGVYLFRSPVRSIDTAGYADMIVFNHIKPEPMPAMGSMQGNDDTPDYTLAVIDQLKKHIHTLQAARVPPFDAVRHLFCSGAQDTPTHGCPTSPPIPVEESGALGQWKITLPQLSDPSLQSATGKGVTVFVLDTLPKRKQILDAASAAGGSNTLLQSMNELVKFNYNLLPDILDVPNPDQPVTGKDIYGRLVGLSMEDHGLAIAGIIHDLAPDANIECIRVLNDFAAGNLLTLIDALKAILDRMTGGDLHNQPVVINLSLVVGPPEADWANFSFDKDLLMASLNGLITTMQNLADQGAVFAASAGNDSDPRDTRMNPLENRFGPRYPAAFADDDHYLKAMIPVGAINQNGKAASYSNYPGPHGIAAYGGELPKPDPWLPSAMSHVNARVDTTRPIDALCGVYTASAYPALSMNDHYPTPSLSMEHQHPEYPAPNSNAWAYWSGTSFATPIISALAARILQSQDPKSIDVRQAVIDATHHQQTMWTGVDSGEDKPAEDKPGRMIRAVQLWWSDDTPKS